MIIECYVAYNINYKWFLLGKITNQREIICKINLGKVYSVDHKWLKNISMMTYYDKIIFSIYYLISFVWLFNN